MCWAMSWPGEEGSLSLVVTFNEVAGQPARTAVQYITTHKATTCPFYTLALHRLAKPYNVSMCELLEALVDSFCYIQTEPG